MHETQHSRRVPHLTSPPEFLQPMTDDEWAVLDHFAGDPARLLLLARFWSKADRSGGPDACWPMPHSIGGRPFFTWGGQQYVAARVAYELVNGPIPPGHFACHTCDNGACVNPQHLYAGTQQQNFADAVARKRMRGGPRGPQPHRYTIGDELVCQVRLLRHQGLGHREIAKIVGIGSTSVGEIIRGERRFG